MFPHRPRPIGRAYNAQKESCSVAREIPEMPEDRRDLLGKAKPPFPPNPPASPLNTRPDLIATYISCDQVASGATQRRWLLAAAGWVRVETAPGRRGARG